MLAVASRFDDRKGVVGVLMATAGTVFELGHGVIDRGRGGRLFMRPGLEVTAVTSGARRGIGGEFIGDNFIVTCMAGTTGSGATVRVVGGAGVRVTHCCPGRGGGVALVALALGGEVPSGGFANRRWV